MPYENHLQRFHLGGRGLICQKIFNSEISPKSTSPCFIVLILLQLLEGLFVGCQVSDSNSTMIYYENGSEQVLTNTPGERPDYLEHFWGAHHHFKLSWGNYAHPQNPGDNPIYRGLPKKKSPPLTKRKRQSVIVLFI